MTTERLGVMPNLPPAKAMFVCQPLTEQLLGKDVATAANIANILNPCSTTYPYQTVASSVFSEVF